MLVCGTVSSVMEKEYMYDIWKPYELDHKASSSTACVRKHRYLHEHMYLQSLAKFIEILLNIPNAMLVCTFANDTGIRILHNATQLRRRTQCYMYM